MIYFVVLILLAILSTCEVIGAREKKYFKTFSSGNFILFSLLVIWLSAFKYNVGPDWSAYIAIFDRSITSIGFSDTSEKGFYLVNRFFKTLFNNYSILQFSISVFCGFSIIKFFYKHSKYPIFSLYVYYAMYFIRIDIGGMNRQWIAMAIVLNGYKYVRRKEFVKYIIVILIAASFHVTAYIAIFGYFLYRKTSKIFLLCLLFVSLMIAFFSHDILLSLLKILGNIHFLPPRIGLLVDSYINANKYADQGDPGIGFFITVCFLLIMIITMNRNDSIRSFLFPFSVYFFFLCVGKGVEILERLAFYFSISSGGLLAYNSLFLKKSFFKGAITILYIYRLTIILYFIIYFIIIIRHSTESYIPYSSIFINTRP